MLVLTRKYNGSVMVGCDEAGTVLRCIVRKSGHESTRGHIYMAGANLFRKETAMGMEMATVKRRAAEALFKSDGEGEIKWLFFALPAGWAITRNGVRVAFGTADRVSIQDGLEKFAAFTHPIAPAADPVVLEQLDRIEGESGRGANGKGVAKLRDGERPTRIHGGQMIYVGMS